MRRGLAHHSLSRTSLTPTSPSSLSQVAALGNLGDVPQTDLWCANLTARTGCWATPDTPDAWALPHCTADCYATEGTANNFAALRHVGGGPLGRGSLYVESRVGEHGPDDDVMARVVAGTGPGHTELYDQATDRWQMRNLAASAPQDHSVDSRGASRGDIDSALTKLGEMLRQELTCSADGCV